MSKKTKASSKNKKAPAKKVAKKPAPKKVVAKKKTAKPVAKAKPVKKAISKAKPAPKKAVAKKPVKKVAPKKVAKKVVAKKPTAKKAASKKPVVKAKSAPKKVAVKAKPQVKVAPKKAVVKAKPVVAKKVEKVVPVKAKEIKAVKPIVEKTVKVKATKPKPAPVKKQIVAPTTFRVEETNTKHVKEPAGKFEMEFVVRASEDMVYEFVSTESGLSEWFCDDVNIRNGIFTFTWDGQTQQAKLVKEMPPLFIRYQWIDKNDGSYFEFRTQKDELTNDISLIITDFADNKADEESARLLWHSQVDKLLHVLGSFF